MPEVGRWRILFSNLFLKMLKKIRKILGIENKMTDAELMDLIKEAKKKNLKHIEIETDKGKVVKIDIPNLTHKKIIKKYE